MSDSEAMFESMADGPSTSKRRVVEEDMLGDMANVEFETSDNVEVIKTFDSLGLKEDLIRGIFAYGKWQILDTHLICDL